MTLIGKILLAGVGLSLTACSSLTSPEKYNLAAEPLMQIPIAADDMTAAVLTDSDGHEHRKIISYQDWHAMSGFDQSHIMVQDSQAKCTNFLNAMFAQTAATNVTLDSLSTLTSALATVFTPTSVTHSLSAASTLFSGVKTSISSDYLNSLAISHITQAIQATYTTDMQKEIDWLEKANKTSSVVIDAYDERSRIESYHNQCSLAAAEGSINSTLQTSATTANGNATAPAGTTTQPSANTGAPTPPPPPPPPNNANTTAPTPPLAGVAAAAIH
jgi:hypothetical protein